MGPTGVRGSAHAPSLILPPPGNHSGKTKSAEFIAISLWFLFYFIFTVFFCFRKKFSTWSREKWNLGRGSAPTTQSSTACQLWLVSITVLCRFGRVRTQLMSFQKWPVGYFWFHPQFVTFLCHILSLFQYRNATVQVFFISFSVLCGGVHFKAPHYL